MKPIIGIVVDAKPEPENQRTKGTLKLNWNYAQAVADAGGVPLLIPPQADAMSVLALLDGLLIPGGLDIDATHFGQDNHPKVKLIEVERFGIESQLLEQMSPNLPYFGICYGCQRLNVQRGGDLDQHLPDGLGHDQHSGGTFQEYGVVTDSKLGSVVGGQAEGESWHHQAVGSVGTDLVVVAKGNDGTIEAVEDPSKPFCIGVQWHPERTPESATTRELFRAFIKAASEFKRLKQA